MKLKEKMIRSASQSVLSTAQVSIFIVGFFVIFYVGNTNYQDTSLFIYVFHYATLVLFSLLLYFGYHGLQKIKEDHEIEKNIKNNIEGEKDYESNRFFILFVTVLVMLFLIGQLDKAEKNKIFFVTNSDDAGVEECELTMYDDGDVDNEASYELYCY